jgi:hypothetical protein
MIPERDPIRTRRHHLARLALAGRALGWLFFAVAVIVFATGLVVGISAGGMVIVVTSLALGSLLLLPAIIVGFAVRAAEREDPGPRS